MAAVVDEIVDLVGEVGHAPPTAGSSDRRRGGLRLGPAPADNVDGADRSAGGARPARCMWARRGLLDGGVPARRPRCDTTSPATPPGGRTGVRTARALPGRRPQAICVEFGRMRRSLVERSLRDVHGRLVRVRQELAVLDEQLVVLNDAADDARIRSLVSETPLAGHEYTDAQRTADAANRARGALAATVEELERRRDELLGQLAVEPR